MKALSLVVLLSATPALAAGSQPPTAFPCWSQSGDELSEAVDENIYPPCPLFLPPACRLSETTCPLFRLVPTNVDAGHPYTMA